MNEYGGYFKKTLKNLTRSRKGPLKKKKQAPYILYLIFFIEKSIKYCKKFEYIR